MPLYEYRCPECEKRMERFRSVDERNHGPLCVRCAHMSDSLIYTRRTLTSAHLHGSPNMPND